MECYLWFSGVNFSFSKRLIFMKFRNISPDDPIISSPFKDLIREDMYGSSAFDDFDSYN